MSIRDHYTEEELKLIIATPAAVISAIIGAGPSGPVQLMQEIAAAVKAFETAAKHQADNPLIAEALVALKGRFQAYLGQKTNLPKNADIDIMAIAQDPDIAIDMCRQVKDLLDRKAADPDAEEFRRWLLSIGERVAEAAKEGSFMGFGGSERVNEQERVVLQKLAAALQISAA